MKRLSKGRNAISRWSVWIVAKLRTWPPASESPKPTHDRRRDT